MKKSTIVVFKVIGWILSFLVASVAMLAGLHQAGLVDIKGKNPDDTIPVTLSSQPSSTPSETSSTLSQPDESTSTPASEPTQEPIIIQLKDLTNIGSSPRLFFLPTEVIDNYGNEYDGSFTVPAYQKSPANYEVLLDAKYSKFQAVFFVQDGESSKEEAILNFVLDGKEIHSVSLDKASKPQPIDLDVEKGNRFLIILKHKEMDVRIGDAAFYS